MADMAQLSYSGLNACTLASEANSSYLANTGHIPLAHAMDGTTLGLMMLISTFQYQAPYMNPTYSNAASQAGKAAFVESGGQDIQNKFVKMVTDNGTKTAHSIGITDTEMGALFFTEKTLRSKQLSFRGPNIYLVKTDLTLTQNSASIGLRWTFK